MPMSTIAPQQTAPAVNRRAAQFGLIALAAVIVLCFALLIAGARGASSFDAIGNAAPASHVAVSLHDATGR